MRWKKALYVGLGIAGSALVVYGLLPAPAQVEAGIVTRGAMEVTVDDQGETRSHDRFLLTAPVSGRLMRIELHDGDAVSDESLTCLHCEGVVRPGEAVIDVVNGAERLFCCRGSSFLHWHKKGRPRLAMPW